MLAQVGLLTDRRGRADRRRRWRRSARRSQPARFAFRQELEDIHMHIERALIDRLGDVGRKLHTGRSRNDQVVDRPAALGPRRDRPDRRLARRRCSGRSSAAATATPASSCPATRTCSGPSRCWPPTTGWPTARSSSATASGWPTAAGASNVLPLGAAALAGTTLPIDRRARGRGARLRGRRRPTASTSSSDRDFVHRVRLRAGADRRAPQHAGPRSGSCGPPTEFGFLQAAAGVLHRLVDHAAEDQPRRAGADPRQDGPRRSATCRRCWCW